MLNQEFLISELIFLQVIERANVSSEMYDILGFSNVFYLPTSFGLTCTTNKGI